MRQRVNHRGDPGAAGRPSRPRRPRRPDAAASREKLLAAATAEFAARGYEGARLEAIARRCRVAKSLIFHHFASKDGLFVEVMERIYRLLRRRQDDPGLVGLDPIGGMRRLAVETFRCFLDSPEIISLMNTENLNRARHIRKSRTIPALYNPLIAAIEALLAEGQRRGLFRHDVDPIDFYISLSGLSYFYLSNRHTLGTVFGIDLLSPERIAARERHIAEVVIGYLTARTD